MDNKVFTAIANTPGSQGSLTHAWANIVIAISAVIEAIAFWAEPIANGIADLMSDPTVGPAILAYIPSDKVPLFTIAIMLVTKVARNRTLPKA